ncbi:MAG: hypothetical protein QXQ50_07810 [Candidatus Bathyarchaeia archaeon]
MVKKKKKLRKKLAAVFSQIKQSLPALQNICENVLEYYREDPYLKKMGQKRKG